MVALEKKKKRLDRVAALKEKKRRGAEAEEWRVAAKLPEQPISAGGGARVGA